MVSYSNTLSNIQHVLNRKYPLSIFVETHFPGRIKEIRFQKQGINIIDSSFRTHIFISKRKINKIKLKRKGFINNLVINDQVICEFKTISKYSFMCRKLQNLIKDHQYYLL